MITKIIPMIFKGMNGNCYLLQTDNGFILVDTGSKGTRKKVESMLIEAGCLPASNNKLNLIIITHGDFDHTGNCAYLKNKYNAPVAMHKDDAGMVENGDMFWNRKSGGRILRALLKLLIKVEKFTPDIILSENCGLTQYGIDAKVLSLPGHSLGSIGILLEQEGNYSRDFFCGDLFANVKRPESGAIIDDKEEFTKSVEIVKSLGIKMVYPGHGTPFEMKLIC